MAPPSTITGGYSRDWVVFMLTIQQERSKPIEIDAGSDVWAVTFSPNGEYLVSGDKGVRVWRVEDEARVAKMDTGTVNCLTVSNHGRWIAAGTNWGEVIVWDATTFEQVLENEGSAIHAVDFSPDSTRLVSASKKVTIWDLASHKQIRTLHHEGWVTAAKYSPQGDRIATATHNGSVRVWGSNDGHLLVDIKVEVVPRYNTGLVWFNDHLFVVSGGKIKELDASTGSAVSEWPVPDSNYRSCIVLPKHEEFIAYSTDRTVTLWDTSTHSQLALIQHPRNIYSVAFSPDDQFLAIGGEDGKISIESLSCMTVSIVSRNDGASEQLCPPLCRVQSHCLAYTPPFRNLTSTSTLLL